ncbi:MAG: hypothetical protein FWD28_05585 [Treponema sp.]|nr:hypothetical protein [Treponema sp.]
MQASKSLKSVQLNKIDFIVIFLLLVIAAFCINLFRIDLLQTLSLRNVEPVGTVVIRQNVVQRRLASRVLWDRLATESPVYIGDLIRVAELSSATLNIKDNAIDLYENTLIRITLAPDGKTLQIILSGGNISIASMPNSEKLPLIIDERLIQPVLQAVFSVVSTENGVRLRVDEGSVYVTEDEQIREIHAGNVFEFETQTDFVPRFEQMVFEPEPETVSLAQWYLTIVPYEFLPSIAASSAPEPVVQDSLLPAPRGLVPARGHRFTMNDLYTQRNLSFSWQAVQGANAYILTIYQQIEGRRRQVYQTQALTRTNYVFEDLHLLDRGTFIWQVEPINREQSGLINQRGNRADSSFIMDILLPGAIQAEGTGVLDE